MSGKVLFILNDPPYGTERVFNGLRLPPRWPNAPAPEARVFLMGDAVGAAMANQRLPDGYYHLDRMIWRLRPPRRRHRLLRHLHGRPRLGGDMLTKGTRRSTLDERADWTLWAEKVLTF